MDEEYVRAITQLSLNYDGVIRPPVPQITMEGTFIEPGRYTKIVVNGKDTIISGYATETTVGEVTLTTLIATDIVEFLDDLGLVSIPLPFYIVLSFRVADTSATAILFNIPYQTEIVIGPNDEVTQTDADKALLAHLYNLNSGSPQIFVWRDISTPDGISEMPVLLMDANKKDNLQYFSYSDLSIGFDSEGVIQVVENYDMTPYSVYKAIEEAKYDDTKIQLAFTELLEEKVNKTDIATINGQSLINGDEIVIAGEKGDKGKDGESAYEL